MSGNGTMLICTVGEDTQVGKLKMQLLIEQPPTPLQLKLEGVAESIGKIGLLAAVMTVAVLIFYLVYDVATG